MVEIQTTSLKTAHVFKRNTHALLENHITPILTKYFDQLSMYNHGKIVRLENLDITIDISENASDRDIVAAFEKALRKKLSTASSQSKVADPKLYELQLEQALMNSGIISTTREKSREQAFFHFLEKGTFPWWKPAGTFFLFEALKEFKKQSQFSTKLKATLTTKTFRNRLIYQFDDAMITLLIASEVPSKRFTLPKTIDRIGFWDIVLEHFATRSKTNTVRQITLELLKIISTNRCSKEQDLRRAGSFLFQLNKVMDDKIRLDLSTNTNELALGSTTIHKLHLKIISNKEKNQINQANSLTIKFLIDDVKSTFILLNTAGNVLYRSHQSSDFTTNHISVKSKELHPSEAVLSSSENERSQIVANAGLLLLHPFLKTFFGNLNMLDGNKIPIEKQDLAVHLLHYLACKKLQPYEHVLNFEKYICNIPMQHPIQKNLVLNEKQINACETLLTAVLGHWTALKTKSTDVLRNEFLSREGKLSITKAQEKVFIQRKTADILLESVPWNLGLIKFPWKKNFVFLEW